MAMGSLRDNLHKSNTVTLSQAEIQFLQETAKWFQSELDRIQQQFATEFLKYVAVTRYEYPLNAKLKFQLDMQKYHDNLTITEEDK